MVKSYNAVLKSMNPMQCSMWWCRQIFMDMEKITLSVAKWENRLQKSTQSIFSETFVCVYVFLCTCFNLREKILTWHLVYLSEVDLQEMHSFIYILLQIVRIFSSMSNRNIIFRKKMKAFPSEKLNRSRLEGHLLYNK